MQVMTTDDFHDAPLPEGIESRATLYEEAAKRWPVRQPDAPQSLIGVPLPVHQGDQGLLLQTDALGVWAVEHMGARVFLIPLWSFPMHKNMYQSLWPLLSLVDGLLVPADIQGRDRSFLRRESEHEASPEHQSIAWERALVQLATLLGMPILALADGAVKWNRAVGGTSSEARKDLAQLPTIPDAWDRHLIRVRAHSQLASYLQPVISRQDEAQPSWELAFMPGQGIEKLARGLSFCGQREDGMPVAFERRDGIFGLGILGRLDWGLDQAYSAALFEAFLHACWSFDQSRQQHAGWEAERETICATVAERVRQGQSLIGGIEMAQSHTLQPPGLRSTPRSLTREAVAQERLRQRSHPPTKAELNRIRRQRLKLASR
jgi:gamma-glutamyl-gamma-aminobutyrate hydrolase PuuD